MCTCICTHVHIDHLFLISAHPGRHGRSDHYAGRVFDPGGYSQVEFSYFYFLLLFILHVHVLFSPFLISSPFLPPPSLSQVGAHSL